MDAEESRSSEFDTTHWTLIVASSGVERQRGLEYVYRAYSRPLRAYLRRFGVAEDDAEDVLHEFLMKVFESGALGRADPARGRFRSYLLGALRHFLSDRRERQRALRRGGGEAVLALEELAPDMAPGVEDDDRRFDEDWALAIFEQSVVRLNEELDRDALQPVPQDLRELVFREQPDSYREIADRLRITVPAVKSRIFRLRRRFQEIIRQEVRRTVGSDADCDEELSYLCTVLSSPTCPETK